MMRQKYIFYYSPPPRIPEEYYASKLPVATLGVQFFAVGSCCGGLAKLELL